MTAKEVKDNSKHGPNSLPFEISEQSKGSTSSSFSSNTAGEQQHHGSRMKRIEAFISSEKLDEVLSAIESLKLAATYYDSKGKGKGEKYTISYGRGVGSSKMAYSDRKTVVTIVEQHRVEDVITAIRSVAARSGTVSAGIIVISSVDDILQI